MTAPLEKLLHVFFTNKIHVISDVKLDETFDVWVMAWNHLQQTSV